MSESAFKVDPRKLRLISDSVLLHCLSQYREMLETIEETDRHDPELASQFAEIVKHYVAEARRRGLGV